MDENGFAQMMTGQQTPLGPMPPQPPQFAGQQAPVPPEVQKMAVPASTPEEVATRKEGWKQVLNNPNFMRALGIMGAQLMQPVQPGQTPLGHLGVGMATGINAFQQGEYSTWRQNLLQQEENRRSAESAANIKQTEARTATETAALPGVEAASDLATRTVEDKVQTARQVREKAEIDLANAKDAQAITRIENELKKRRLEIEKGIPDEKIRAAALAEIDGAVAKLEETRARTGETKAKARKEGAQAAQQEITTKILKEMSPEEQKAFLTKTGKYGTHQSGISQQAQMWGEIYDKLPADDPSKKGKTREQFQMARLTEAKGADALKMLTDYLKNTLDPDPDIVQLYTDLAKQAGQRRLGKDGKPEGDGKEGGKEVPWVDAHTGYQKRTKADGTIEYRRKP